MAPYLLLLFLLAFFLHNAEEAVWLVRASAQPLKMKRRPRPTQDQFLFAVLFVTAVAVLITALYLFYPDQWFLKYAYFGYVGAMILNVLLVHLSSTIIEKKYSPGLMTGLLLLVPVNGLLIINAFQSQLLSIAGFIGATVIMAVLLLLAISVLFRLAGKWINY
ncbi:HXXEE domain-containing protein [Sporolactobacillus shoreicorticis]|uniref:HXXEE domain-containing protein n=1 Tax=Sporolactobacillus shoreicorticis TaxID=1923877 RepID=A0ABW5S087_9BACL|nr:HXXEE domain-containing protein [Sporolactobacillus shoreicorticis]MCO7127206.1 HXXEE domain-containing protein [Sporolactobacillus shoreicorticis]